MSVCVMVLVVVVVSPVVLMWMVLMVWVAAGVLAVVLAIVMMQGVLVEAACVGAVSWSSSGSFEVAVALEVSRLLSYSGWRMALWCWNERGNFFGRFSLISVAGNMFVAAGACLFGMVIRW